MKIFAENTLSTCCLCGSPENLTGEHKFKVTALRKEFGKNPFVTFTTDNTHQYKPVQSVKSKSFHFLSRLCSECNNSRTQPADREFDIFHNKVTKLMNQKCDPSIIFKNDRYLLNSIQYLNVFRYFAKLICCQLAEIGGPRPIGVALFALGLHNYNPVKLNIRQDFSYKQFKILAEHGFAFRASATLLNTERDNVREFYSVLTFGRIQYQFSIELTLEGMNELEANYTDFCQWCINNSKLTPILVDDKLRLGFGKG